MSSINFRLYGEQLYGFTNKYLNEYINPEIKKEEFLTNFKNGLLNLNITGIKKPINIFQQISIKDLKTEKIEIHIPDEKTNFIIRLSHFKVMLIINELNQEQIKSLIINERKKLIEKFIKETINQIEKKDGSSSFLKGLINSLLTRVFEGLEIELNDIEIYLKCNNYLFLLKIDNIVYNEKEGIKLNNINLIFNDSKNEDKKAEIIKKFCIGILIKNDKENNNNSIKINLSDLYLEINPNIYMGIINIINLLNEINYAKRYARNKELIDFYKPIKNNDKKKYYRELWFWAIKTVVKLIKYKSHEKIYIFDLINSTQVKLSKKYINSLDEKKNNDKNEIKDNYLILPEEIVLLKSTKDIVEKQLLENKKGNKLANAFKFLWGGGDDEEKNELTEEEKNSLNNAYTTDNIINFIIGQKIKDDKKVENNNDNEEQVIDKLKNFFNNISFNCNINKIEILLNHFDEKHSIYIKNINTLIDINRLMKIINYEFIIGDIGYDLKNTILKNKINEKEIIKFIKNKENFEINFGFKNFEINDKIILFIINFYFSLYYADISEENQNKFFIKTKLTKKDKQNSNIFSIIDRIKISNIPKFNILNSEKGIFIFIEIINFTINKTFISFIINIKDNNSNPIIDNYEIKILKNEENTKYNLELTNKLKVSLQEKITEFLFSFFWQIRRLRQHYEIIQHISNSLQKNNKELLYGFIYKIYKKLNIDDSFLNLLYINLSISSILLEINEKYSKTTLVLANLTLTYSKNKNLLFKLGTLTLTTNKSAPLFLYNLKLKSSGFNEYETLLTKKLKNEFNLDINEDLLNKNNVSDQINNIYTYQKEKCKLINQLINSCKIYITEIKAYFQSDENIFCLFLNRTLGEKKLNSFIFKVESYGINYFNIKNMKNIINVMEAKENLFLEFNYMNKKLEIKTKTPKIFLNIEIIKTIKESINFKIDKKRLKGLFKKLKIKIEIQNIFLILDKFNFSILILNFRNYDYNYSKTTVFTNIENIEMKRNDNNSGLVLLKEKEIKLIYKYSPKTEKYLNIQTTVLNFMISEEDLNCLITTIFNVYMIFKKELNEQNNIHLKNEAEKISNIQVDFKMNMISLSLCSNYKYNKIGELLISATRFIIKSYYIENKNIKNEFIKQIDFSILINKILLKYFDMNNNELILLKSESDKNINHIELFCNNNKNITININKNYIILRGDSFYSFYQFFKKAIPLNEIKSKIKTSHNNKLSNVSQLKFNFEYTKFLIPWTFNVRENLCFNVEKFNVLFYSVNDSKFPNGIFNISLSSMSSVITSNNITRKLFYSKNQFLCVQINFNEKNLNLVVSLDTLIINLSCTDIIKFLYIYFFNKALIEREKKLSNNDINNQIKNINQHHHYFQRLIKDKLIKNSIIFSGNFTFENFNITLIDNSSGSYYPFANLNLNKINLQCNPDFSIYSYFSVELSSYNYISCVWEPIIEKDFIQFKYLEYKDNKNKNKNFQIDVNQINVNISDMSISFTLNSLNNWMKKLIEEKQSYNIYGMIGNNLIDFKNNINQLEKISKITNNKINNQTGIKLEIHYANNIYNCDPYSEIELEYINEWDTKIYGPKQISLFIDSKTNFFIPIEKICCRIHKINKDFYIVSENNLSKDRQININVYSPIIFKNKSLYQLQINIFNRNKGNENYFLDLNSSIGLPLYYYDQNTIFNFNLIDGNSKISSINYSINEILCLRSNENYKKNIIIDKTILLMSLSRKIPQVKTILINCEYVLINCLPCNIGITAKGNNYIIEKCSQQYIDFYSENDKEISIQITANNTTFFSNPKRLFQKVPKETGNFLKFKNNKNKDSFRLSLLIKNKYNKKVIVIYAESILENKSGFDFYIKSKNICFQIGQNLYLISSKINVKESFFTINNEFYNYKSKNISLGDIIHSSPSYILDLKNNKNLNDNYNNINSSYQIRLIIDNSMSYVTLKNNPNNKYNIITMIYGIYSSHRITNLLSTKNFIIASQENPGEYIYVEPMSQINFDFFHKGVKTPLMFSVNNLSYNNYNSGKFTSSFNFREIGTYTFKIDDNLFNLEIRKSSSKGIIDVFVVETNFDNAKIIIENLTNNVFNIYQKNYENLNQIIRGNDKQILNIYDQNLMKFYCHFGDEFHGEFEFIPSETLQKKIDCGGNIIMCMESNGIKMKVSFYYRDILQTSQDFIENYYFCAKINEALISVIGDNEFVSKKLRNYERNEILLLVLNNLYLEVNWDKNIGLLSKDLLNTNVSIENIALYNQINNNAKYIKAFNNINNPFISLKNTIYHFKNDNVWKIGGFRLFLSNSILNIDPVFIEEIMNFVKNIIYRMKIKNYNVDKLFLKEDNINKSINLNEYQNKIKEYIKNYNKKGLVFHGNNFQLPKLKIDFIISKVGLEHLLVNKFGFSSFFVWAAKGLTEQKNSINLENYTIPLYIGDFKGIIKLIYQRYKHSIKSEFVNIGIKGFFGNISKIIDKKIGKKVIKFFNNGLENILGKEQNNYDNIEIEESEYNYKQEYIRKRSKRAFYGKFKYFKEFNQDDAYYFDLIPKKINNNGMKFIFTNFLKGSNNNIYVFTDSAFLIMTTNVEVYNTIYYFYISNVNWRNNQIFINYNQNIDGNNFYQFYVENSNFAQKLCNILIEETAKNKDNFNDI